MGNRPMIGISGSHNIEEHQVFVRENYIDALLKAGAMPVLLPELQSEAEVRELISELDGLLLAGGGDVHPPIYGEEKLEVCGDPDHARDTFELLAVRCALEINMPIFGICRGIQVLNTALGGTLYQDIPSQRGIPREFHSQEKPYSAPIHSISLAKNGLFESIVGNSMMVNSMHHQSIKELAPSLEAEGWSDDGIIEAVRMRGRDDVFAVQFHPEYLAQESKQAMRLFEHFAFKAKAFRNSHR